MARVKGYDVIRGATVLSMVGFHYCYDLAYLRGVELAWFEPPFQDIWRASISWTFLFLAGIMCSYSKDNVRRGLRYLALALAIFIATTLVAVDVPINFGIIYCMGFSTIAASGLMVLGAGRLSFLAKLIACCACMVLFVLCLGIPRGTFGLAAFGGPFVRMPDALYDSGFLSWLGFPGPTFASGDYYPPLPYTLVFLAGMFLGPLLKGSALERQLGRLCCVPLEWIGRHPLVIYVVHQPLLLLFSGVL